MSMLVNLRPYINEAALVTLRTTSLRRVSKLFLSMGLRHLLVVESCPKVSRPIAFARLAPTGPRRTLPRITPPLGSRLALFKPPLPPLGCRCHHAQGPARRWRHGGAHAAAVVFGLQPGRHRHPLAAALAHTFPRARGTARRSHLLAAPLHDHARWREGHEALARPHRQPTRTEDAYARQRRGLTPRRRTGCRRRRTSGTCEVRGMTRVCGPCLG